MNDSKIRQIFQNGWQNYCNRFNPSDVQHKTARCIMACRTGEPGYNISYCEECGHIDFHANSCRNRNCPNCQAVLKELRIDKRRSEMIDARYFHVVFTIPAELNPLAYANQKLLYGLLHKCSAETLLELSRNKKYLGGAPGIIQVLHTWGQGMNYHPHIHCIISGGGLTKAKDLKLSGKKFFIPIEPLIKKFRGKFLYYLQQYYQNNTLVIPKSCIKLKNCYAWAEFRSRLYRTGWNAEIKETFNGHGNAVEYPGRYTNRIAITNARIKKVTDSEVTFSAKDYKTGMSKDITIPCVEFIRRFMMHVLPSGFQKIRYYGFLNNRSKKKNLMMIFRIQGHRKYQEMLSGLTIDRVILTVWKHDIKRCPECGCSSMRHIGRTFAMRN